MIGKKFLILKYCAHNNMHCSELCSPWEVGTYTKLLFVSSHQLHVWKVSIPNQNLAASNKCTIILHVLYLQQMLTLKSTLTIVRLAIYCKFKASSHWYDNFLNSLILQYELRYAVILDLTWKLTALTNDSTKPGPFFNLRES